MSDARLLPPNRSALESALAAVSTLALDTAGLRHLWSARDCLAEALPWLSWALTVEGWSDARSEGTHPVRCATWCPVSWKSDVGRYRLWRTILIAATGMIVPGAHKRTPARRIDAPVPLSW